MDFCSCTSISPHFEATGFVRPFEYDYLLRLLASTTCFWLMVVVDLMVSISQEEVRNWLELPSELWLRILMKLDAIEILSKAQNVCCEWRKICEEPLMWRIIDMQNLGDMEDDDLEIMCRQAVDRSCGQLVDINIQYFGTDELLQYITMSSNQVRKLRIVDCDCISDEGLAEAVSKLPLLEHLEIWRRSFDGEITLKCVGQYCPHLKSLKLNKEYWGGRVREEEALAIAETMPKLRHLQIFGNRLSDRGLQAILDGCLDLESLDLRQCFNLRQVKKICGERIKVLHLPHHSTDGFAYEFTIPTHNLPADVDEDYCEYLHSALRIPRRNGGE